MDDLKFLREPLTEFGRRWAASTLRPRPSQDTLAAWDRALDAWVASGLPLILRKSGRRGERATCSNGREVVFADNSPANWAFSLALNGQVPDVGHWSPQDVSERVPLSILTRGNTRDLNRDGWKVCHIDPVSDGRRYKVEEADFADVEARFRRFLSPRNVFLIPKEWSGAGELPEVIEAVAEFESGIPGESRGHDT